MKVHWTDTAIGHLRSLHAYIGQSSPEYAQSVVDSLHPSIRQVLTSNPPSCMRKLLTMLNAMLKHRPRWRTELRQHA